VKGIGIAGILAISGNQQGSDEAGELGCARLETMHNPAASPALIVGLGNPGIEYSQHRHNVGFRVVDQLAKDHDLSFRRVKWARARAASGRIVGRKAVLAKPQTFMNLSGRAVGRLGRYYEIPPDCILVVYDELDLPFGRLRLRPQGGAGGHKGMRSIIETLGTQSFPRLRVGIDRPLGRLDPAEYVLQPFDADQVGQLAQVVERAVAAIECWLEKGIEAAMDRFNRPPVEAVSGVEG
jgi:PTH1 family peptidyl-tRNA hydrolase